MDLKCIIEFLKESIKRENIKIQHECYNSDMLMAMAMNKRFEKLKSVREFYKEEKEEKVEDNRTDDEIINDTLKAFKKHYEEKRG